MRFLTLVFTLVVIFSCCTSNQIDNKDLVGQKFPELDYLQSRLWPESSFSKQAYLNAVQEAKQEISFRSSGNWETQGPGNLDQVNIGIVSQTVEVDEGLALQVFPTIASNELNIKSNSEFPLKYTIVNSTGKLLLHGITGSTGIIDISRLSSGTYYFSLRDGDGQINKQFIKQ